MDEHTRILIQVRLEKAQEDLATAHELASLGRFRAAVNRAYYAIYHLATAVLLTKEIERSKHAGVQAAFGHHFIKPGLIEPEYGRILVSARKARETCDYADRIELDTEVTMAIIADADRFVVRMKSYLEGCGALDHEPV